MAIIYPLSSRRAMLSEKPQTLISRSALASPAGTHDWVRNSQVPFSFVVTVSPHEEVASASSE